MGVETIDKKPTSGGGGGFDSLRPTANFDEEGPDKRTRVVEAIRRIRYGTARKLIGVLFLVKSKSYTEG